MKNKGSSAQKSKDYVPNQVIIALTENEGVNPLGSSFTNPTANGSRNSEEVILTESPILKATSSLLETDVIPSGCQFTKPNDTLTCNFTNVRINPVCGLPKPTEDLPEDIFDDTLSSDCTATVIEEINELAKEIDESSFNNSKEESVLTKNSGKDHNISNKKKKKRKSKIRNTTVTSKEIEMQEKIEKLQARLKEKEEELRVVRKLNEDLQNKILNKMDEYASRTINPFSTAGLGDVALGHIDKETNKIHCGNNFYMCYDRYLDAINRASSLAVSKTVTKKQGGTPRVQSNKQYTTFVKSVAVTIVGLESLKNGSVTGRKCNRIKGLPPKPAIDPAKFNAIKGIFSFYLQSELKLDPVAADLEMIHVSSYIASKIQDLNRQPRVQRKLKEQMVIEKTSVDREKSAANQQEDSESSESEDEESSSDSGNSDNN